MKYKIKEFSQHMGVTVDLVKHYEKHNIIKPEREKRTGYRYYRIKQGEQILASRRFRSMGFTITESEKLMNEYDLPTIIETLESKRNEIEKEILNLQRMEKRISDLKEQCILFRDEPATFKVVNSPSYYYLQQTVGRRFEQDDIKKAIVKEWMQKLPFVVKAAMIPGNVDEKDEDFLCSWGIAVEEKAAESIGIELKEPVKYIASRECLKFIMANADERFSVEMVKEVLDKIKALGYKAYGDVLVESGIDCKLTENGLRGIHYILWIPIE